MLDTTYRQKLLKADFIIFIAVEFLDDLSHLVPRDGMASAFQELLEFEITDVSVMVQICRDTNNLQTSGHVTAKSLLL